MEAYIAYCLINITAQVLQKGTMMNPAQQARHREPNIHQAATRCGYHYTSILSQRRRTDRQARNITHSQGPNYLHLLLKYPLLPQ